MQIIGLTGSIGMGKSATANLFREEGVPVHDSDAAVHELYAGPAASQVEAAFPGTVLAGHVDRNKLRERVLGNAAALRQLEAIVHPLVARHRDAFLLHHRSIGTPIVVLDIPLLFEVGAERLVDKVLVVTAPESVQRSRVLGRSGMTDDKLAAILSQQMPDAEKRRRADFVMTTDGGLEDARGQLRAILETIRHGTTPK